MRFLGSASCWARIPAHGSNKPAIVRITGFSFQMVPHPTGYSRADGMPASTASLRFLRAVVDAMEEIVTAGYWPVPTYDDILFYV